MNKVMIIGRLGADPEIRYTQAGAAVTNLNVATSERWKDKQSGEPQERTEWHRVVIFGKSAEIAKQYLKKGSQVYIEGRLQTRKWQDKSGQDRYTTEVVSNGMEMLGSGNGNSSGNSRKEQQAPPGNKPAQPTHQAPPDQYVPNTGEYDDDIPF